MIQYESQEGKPDEERQVATPIVCDVGLRELENEASGDEKLSLRTEVDRICPNAVLNGNASRIGILVLTWH